MHWVVGVELFNSLTALGFNGLQLLTQTTMKPFDRERNGLILAKRVRSGAGYSSDAA